MVYIKKDSGRIVAGAIAASALSLLASATSASAVTFDYSGSIDTFNVTTTGVYQLDAFGAQGGSSTAPTYVGGLGGELKGDISLNAGTVLSFLVGGRGGDAQLSSFGILEGGGGGGGGTFVTTVLNGTPTLLLAAGGGGGGSLGGGTIYGGFGGGGGGISGDGRGGAKAVINFDGTVRGGFGGNGGYSGGGGGASVSGGNGGSGGFGGGGGGGVGFGITTRTDTGLGGKGGNGIGVINGTIATILGANTTPRFALNGGNGVGDGGFSINVGGYGGNGGSGYFNGSSGGFGGNGVYNAIVSNVVSNNAIKSGNGSLSITLLSSIPDPVPNPTSVPEPFTVIGSLCGGVAAFKMRKKLQDKAKLARK
jgi:hypothetical protein